MNNAYRQAFRVIEADLRTRPITIAQHQLERARETRLAVLEKVTVVEEHIANIEAIIAEKEAKVTEVPA